MNPLSRRRTVPILAAIFERGEPGDLSDCTSVGLAYLIERLVNGIPSAAR